MKKFGFQRVVAVFVGILLIPAVILVFVTGEESLVGSVLALAAVYVVYMILFLRKLKEQKSNTTEKTNTPRSPLMRL